MIITALEFPEWKYVFKFEDTDSEILTIDFNLVSLLVTWNSYYLFEVSRIPLSV